MPQLLPPDVQSWLDAQDPADRPELSRTWDAAGLAEPEPADSDAAWARLDALLDEPAPRRAADRPALRLASRRQRAGWVALAVAALAVVAVGMGLRSVRVATGTEVAQVALPDGSTVVLAPGSEIRYRRGLWGGRRDIALAGQAHFDVTSDGRPFQVETFDATVEVLGTVFDVRAWPDAPAAETAVALLEGSVRFQGRVGAPVTLTPGQASRTQRGIARPPTEADLDASTAWQRGGFSIADAPLGAVAAAVEAQYQTSVVLGPRVDPGSRLSLFLPDADRADQVLADVAAYLDLRLVVRPDGYDLLAR